MSHSETLALSTSGNNGLEARLSISVTDDSANNRSRIQTTLAMRKTNGFNSQGNMSGHLWIGGSSFAVSGNKTVTGAWTTIGTASYYHSHSAAGVAAAIGVGVSSVAMSGSSDYDTPVTGSTTLESANFTNYVRLPGAPGTPTHSFPSATSIKFDWAAASSPVAITDYGQYMYIDSGLSTAFITPTWIGTARTFTYTGVTRGSSYWFRTRCRSSEGTGPFTSTVKVTVPHTKPDKPATPTVSSITATSAKINTTPPSYVGAGATAREVQIRSGTTVVKTATTEDPTITGLSRNTSYTSRYRIQNAVGWSDWSNDSATFKTLGVPPSAPTGYIGTEIASTSFKVTLGSLADNGGAAPTNVRVKVSTTASDTGLVKTVTSGSWTQPSVTGLTADTQYYVAEAAYNNLSGGGWGPYGAWVAVKTKSNVPNSPVLTVGTVGETTASLSWTEPSQLNGATIQGYRLTVATNSGLTQNVQTFDTAADALTYSLTTLVENTQYYASVFAKTNNGDGSASDVNGFKTLASVPGSGSGIWVDVAGTPKFAEVWLDIGSSVVQCEVWVDVDGTPVLVGE